MRRLPAISMMPLFLLSLSLVIVSTTTGQEIKIATVQKINLSGNDLIEVSANEPEGFNFPFFLFIPEAVNRTRAVHLLVETNNTGTATDEFQVHYEKARNLAYRSYASRMAQKLGVPLLVPTFPRLQSQWQAYTHALDRDTLEIKDGSL